MAAGLALIAAANALQTWAMVVNPFFSPEIRLQPDRGQSLITRGPYRLLRHPGYLAKLLSVPASALAIGSCLALVPAAASCLVILKRVGAAIPSNSAGVGVGNNQSPPLTWTNLPSEQLNLRS